MIKRIIKSIPNTITSFNLISGLIATYFAFNFDKPIGDSGLYGYHITYIAIAAAALFDFCDGLSARLLGAYSNIGKELDSLADLVSFGVAGNAYAEYFAESDARQSCFFHCTVYPCDGCFPLGKV